MGTPALPSPATRTLDSRRWLALVFIALAQLMVALDATIVNIALPSAQRALGGSDGQRQWVITAYTLAFAGLLLLGGRIADYAGRKRTFLMGLAGFAAASALGGAAPNLGTLVGARTLQGAFAALLTPTALSLLAVSFTDARERAKAFAVYGAIAGSGGALGLILGGALTQSLSWRWCLYVNLPVAVVAALGGSALLADVRGSRSGRFDVPGVALAVGALVTLVDACTLAVSDGWGARSVIAMLATSSVLLALFLLRESSATEPLLPLRILRDRNRAGAYLAVAGAVGAMYGSFLLLTYDFQVVLGYSPLRAGLAFLPLSAMVFVSSGAIASRLLPHVPPRALMVPGLLVAAAGMLVLTRLTVDASYVVHILPAEILLGLGMGCVFVPAFNVATQAVNPREAGVASAMVNTAQQVGGSIGTALLNTIAAGATSSYLVSHAPGASTRVQALVHGYSAATGWGAGILAAAAVLAGLLVTAGRPVARTGAPRAAGPDDGRRPSSRTSDMVEPSMSRQGA
ncbi:MAG: MFS transporter [Chloroflexi bacterium]|nr:MAG: MFS transporter [Chloroflexota bacterium]